MPGQEFFRPLPLIALMVMAINDHWLRLSYPNWFTGKLSDFAVVLFFPALLTACYNNLIFLLNKVFACHFSDQLSVSKIHIAATTTAVLLMALNLSETSKQFCLSLLEMIDYCDWVDFRYTKDYSDLIALLLLPIAIWDAKQTITN